MANQFGERVKQLRVQNNLLQRQVASILEIDTPMLSKIEKGLRKLKREQIPVLAKILKANAAELQTLWLADQIYAVVKNEKFANEAMQVAEQKLKIYGNLGLQLIQHTPSDIKYLEDTLQREHLKHDTKVNP
jgi:transcriptional regulator with XRE-family HTH domain